MHNLLAARARNLKPSETLAISAKAAALRSQGKDIISLSAGEPDFRAPVHVEEAAIAAVKQGFSHYTPVAGLPSLIAAIQQKFLRENNLTYNADEILVSTGCKQSIYNLLNVLLESGDEVIIPAPYWVSYTAMVELAEGTPVIVPTTSQNSFKLTAADLERAITKNTKLIIINSPSNPSGQTYSKAELLDLAAVLTRHPQVYIMSDDIYEQILWHTDGFYNLPMVAPELKDRTIIVNGVSKSYAMTGWRIGYAAGPKIIIKAMQNLQSQSTSCACAVAQKAAEAALIGPQECVAIMRQRFQQRHELVYQGLKSIPGIDILPATGTFYSFVGVEQFIKRSTCQNDAEFAEYLLDTALVAVVPGGAFGVPNYLRLSFATSEEALKAALARIATALSNI